MKKLTKAMLATGGALLLGAGAVANYLMAQQPQTAQEELTLANLEAMALIDPDDPDNPDLDPNWTPEGMVVKPCYMTFTNDYSGDYYATCSQVSSNPQIMYPCGAISSKKPAWGVTAIYNCYEPAWQG